ncbi:MAG: hypothetical protein JST59_23715 [Actinobacteria bacterium]|nr:hypothetical protein [Actinomycetota bacterium]
MERAPYNYISVAWFEDQATKLLGMVPKSVVAEEFSKLEEELAEKTERLEALEHLEEKADEIMAAAEVLGELMGEKVPA